MITELDKKNLYGITDALKLENLIFVMFLQQIGGYLSISNRNIQ